MLWRQSYTTRILRDLPCPDEAPQGPEVWIGGFDFAAIADQGVWWKLFQSDFPGDLRIKRIFFVDEITSEGEQLAKSLVPRSEAEQVRLVVDTKHHWRDLVLPDNAERGFAIMFDNGAIPIVMIGPPTEDAWEEFSREWRLRT